MSVATEADKLLERVLAGEEQAWTELVERVHPTVLEICRRRRFVGGPGDPEDTHRDVAVRALDRLRAKDFAALRAFCETRRDHANASFTRWLAVVVSNTYVDYLRSQPDYQRKREEKTRRLRRLRREPLDDSASGVEVDPLTVVEIRRAIDCVSSDLFPRDQRAAIAMWLRGHDATEIARELGLSGPDQATKLLHAARQRLRRAFHGGDR